MTTPKPGDRVRVTVDGYWHKAGVFVSDSFGAFGNTRGGFSSIEVLPTPVYVNSDSTDYKLGDVVRSIDGLIATRANRDGWWIAGSGYVDDEDIARPLTLLVRDGEVKVRS